MEIKIHESQPLMADQRIMPELTNRQSRTIKPVSKSKGSATRKVGDDQEKGGKEDDSSDAKHKDGDGPPEEFIACPEPLASTPCMSMEQIGRGDLETMEPPACEPVRQVPLTDLIKVHTEPKEVRGRIFDAKI